jgi:myo-inositol-1(or 4)-monophosphatase
MRVRMLGTAAGDLALTADGRLDGCLSLVNRPWDNAAGAVILAEAGALVTDADGEPYTTESREIIAGPPAITRELAALVREARHALLHGSGISAA